MILHPAHVNINLKVYCTTYLSGTWCVIIRSYKSSVTRWCRKNKFEYFQWQRNYYEHIIRNEQELYQIRKYIRNNPAKWELDNEHPDNKWYRRSMVYCMVSHDKPLNIKKYDRTYFKGKSILQFKKEIRSKTWNIRFLLSHALP